MQKQKHHRATPGTRSIEYRALQMMDSIPDGCGLFPVMDDRSDPHLRRGEIAVVDLGDCRPQNGEVYVIQWARGDRSIVQVWNGRLFDSRPGRWWTAALTARERVGFGAMRMVDGPRTEWALAAALIGRVIGILESIPISLN